MKKKALYNILSILIWILLWQIVAQVIDKPVILPTPFCTIKAFFSLFSKSDFYKSIGFTLSGITTGFLLGFVLGIVFAAISSLNNFLHSLTDIPLKVIKSIPIASFVILALLWIQPKNLSTLIVVFMVMPGLYSAMYISIKNTDKKLLEMAEVFRRGRLKKIIYIYLPSSMPSLISSSKTAAGFAFKAGVAAEIIGLIRNSAGNNIYLAKLYLDTPALFAWTIVLVLLSVVFEKLILFVLKLIAKKTGGTAND